MKLRFGLCMGLLLLLIALPVSAEDFVTTPLLTLPVEVAEPKDYAICGECIYLLDSDTNTVLVYANGELVDRYQLDGMVATHIAVWDGELYAMGTNMQVYHVTKTESRVLLDISPWNDMDSIADFAIRDDRLHVTLPGRDGGKTYVFSIDALQDRAKEAEPTILTEQTLADGTTYTVTPILEDDYLLSGLWELELTYPDGSVKTLPVRSTHMLAGVEPLTLGEDSFVALISEVDSDEDYRIVYTQSLWELTYEGEILHTQPLPDADSEVKVIDGAVYYLHTTEDAVELVQIMETIPSAELPEETKLVEVTPIVEETPIVVDHRNRNRYPVFPWEMRYSPYYICRRYCPIPWWLP